MLIHEFTQPVEEGIHDKHIFKAVFMAGGPGAGKSTVARKLFGHSSLKVLNVDHFWHLYQAQGKQGTYRRYWELQQIQKENYLAGRLGMIIDGTARNPIQMSQVKAGLEELGYETAMVFVNTSLEVSLARTVTRAGTPGTKDYQRSVDEEFTRSVWQQVQNNLGQLQAMFGRRFYIVDNNDSTGNPDVSYVSKTVDRWLNAPPSTQAAKAWIKDQLDMRKQDADENPRDQ